MANQVICSMSFTIQDAFFDNQDFKVINKIGRGAFASVNLVENKNDHKKYALKIFTTFDNKNDANFQKNLMIEISIHQKVNHPAICKFYGINFVSLANPDQFQPSMLIDYCPKGSLYNMIDLERKSMAWFDWNLTKKIIVLIGIAHSLKYLHEQGILYRDLKPENVVLDDYFYPKLIDFGSSISFPYPLSNGMEFDKEELFGSPIYMAPELLKDNEKYGPAIDVYSYSLLAFSVIAGQFPFVDENPGISIGKLNEKVLNGERPIFTADFTKPMENLISKCWNEDPSERLSFGEIYEELSTNYKSYAFNEDIDEEEIFDYIEYLNE